MKMSLCSCKMVFLSSCLALPQPSRAIMICPRPLSVKDTSIMAVAALDDLVNDLVKASCLNMSPAFLDWIADEATPLVERCVARSLSLPRFTKSLQMGDPRIAMARWVRHWVSPWIADNFEELAVYLPEIAESRPAGLLPMAPEALTSPRPRVRHHARPGLLTPPARARAWLTASQYLRDANPQGRD